MDSDQLLAVGVLSRTEIFKEWPQQHVHAIAAQAKVGRYVRGESFWPSNPRRREIVVIASGFVDVLSVTAKGRRFLLNIFGPGEVMGLLRLMPGEPAAYHYCARENAVAVHLKSDDILDRLSVAPLLWESVARMTLRQYRVALDRVVARRMGNMGARLARELDQLASMHGIPDGNEVQLPVRVTQEDLAAMLSTTRQTINKELLALTDAGIISVSYSSFFIRDIAALQRRFRAEQI